MLATVVEGNATSWNASLHGSRGGTSELWRSFYGRFPNFDLWGASAAAGLHGYVRRQGRRLVVAELS